MAWMRKKKPYDRSRIMAEASRARKRRKRHKAISLYQEVLKVEPQNHEIHRKVAPLQAETGQAAEAWLSYRRATEGMVRGGFVDQAIGVLREASNRLPRQVEVWGSIADLEMERTRPIDAHKALLEGRRHFRAKRYRAEAVQLLLRARKLAPRHFATVYDLAGLLAAAGAGQRAQRLLDDLSSWATGSQLRRVRGKQFRLSPTPAAAWRWLRALFGRR